MDLLTGLFYCAFTCVLDVYPDAFADGKLNNLLQFSMKKKCQWGTGLGAVVFNLYKIFFYFGLEIPSFFFFNFHLYFFRYRNVHGPR